MTVTAKLLRLYLVDKQLRGLTSRLQAAEKYLADQDRLLKELDTKHSSIASQLRLLEATNKNDENEAASLDTRVETLRERMNNAKTSKEHAAFLAEVGTQKDAKKVIEDRMLESMGKIETLRKELAEIETKRDERKTLHKDAIKDRDARAAEIKDRVAELEKEREVAKRDVPSSALATYEARVKMGHEDVMAPVEEQDRRNLEYTCGSCYTHLPIEQVSILLKRGDVTRCTTCQAILYMAQELKADIDAGHEKKAKQSAKKAAAAKE
jgi:predicted  nucleic acid-binding Zn-ribbon protein